ncbi:unnamed protein product [Peronospora belbahrii]|uniref:Uncharacterized protein n=1 Tax=Peronospora belbahrii TaxID=622444 RepID=A0AAU9L1F9_9STRA|nr:unnamed protein product [Peronospora belbahrii]CAH0519345.1 unnamed protein product [Peronospora belbahrii]
MLPSRERLQERQGQHAPPRHEYLQQLVDEFQRSPDNLRKEEVVAHLANFAYAPINYTSLGRLRVMDLFLDILAADQENSDVTNANYDEKTTQESQQGRFSTASSPEAPRKNQLVEFAIDGICNCVIDPQLQQQFIDGDGVNILAPYILEIPLEGEHPTSFTISELNVRVSALSIAYFLLNSRAFRDITRSKFMIKMQSLEHHSIVQIANTAAAFLGHYQELVTPMM